MPTYDYICAACGHQFEHFQGMNDKLLRKCPECSRLKLERQIGTGAGLIFKGSGFYITDYRNDSYKQAAKKDQGPSASPDSDKSSDTPKPAKKADKPKPAKKPKKTP